MDETRLGPRPRLVGFLRPYALGAAVLLVFAVLCLLVQLQSSSLILWTGDPVRGTDDGGIVYYTVKGEERTLDAPGDAPAQPEPVTVWTDPDDGSRDRLESAPVRWFDAALVLTPVVAAAAVLGLGVARRETRRRAAVRRQAVRR